MSDFNITIDELKPYCEDFTADQLNQARQICLEYRLTPLKRQVHFSLRNKKDGDSWKKEMSYLVTVDGLRGIAERTSKYEGQVGPFWCGEDGKWFDVWLSAKPPTAAKIGVHKNGFRDALYAVAKFDAYKQTDKTGKITQVWSKMPDLMIAKCAEALALRRAFPDELSGLYTKEEMDQAENPPVVKETLKKEEPEVFTSSDERKAWLKSAVEHICTIKAAADIVKWQEVNSKFVAALGDNQKAYLTNHVMKHMESLKTEIIDDEIPF